MSTTRFAAVPRSVRTMAGLFAAGMLLLVAAPAHALRCGTRVVDVGDRDFAVRDRCGEPYFTEESYALEIHGANGPYEVQDETLYEVWYYNFGPRRLLVRLLFRDGRLVREETLGYGVSELGDDCNLDTLRGGTPGGEIVARCGVPSSRNPQNRTVVRRDGRGNERFTQIRREEWVYDLGPNHRVRVLQLENGRLESIDTERR